MSGLDIFIIIAYLIALLAMGVVVSKRIESAKDLFSAGGKSPWWLAGISAYMTMFSSGTFVVWGGIAYHSGMVAVTICMTYGISALMVGYAVAAKWRATGVHSAGEFVKLRYGEAAFQMFTWMNLLSRMIGVGVAIYSISVLVSALISLPPEHILADSATGKLSVNWAIVITGFIVIGYTIAGGLWAVLMTDVLQFIVLTCAVLVAVPLLFIEHGGVGTAFASLPEGHLDLITSNYTIGFLMGWTVLNALKIGGEWAFVQRSLCVRSPVDAKKANILFGVVYLITPLFWMLPPMLYAGINPAANPEEAYILSIQHVLPAGLIGLMIAAMFSATASMADSEINVFSGALTLGVYKNKYPNSTEKQLVSVGRKVTTILGALVILVALGVPYFGGAEKVVLTAVNLLVGPMIMPIVWALLSKRVNVNALWSVMAVSFTASIVLKFVIPAFDDSSLAIWVAENRSVAEQFTGLVIPAVIMLYYEYVGRANNVTSEGWTSVSAFSSQYGMAEDKQIEADENEDVYNNNLLIGYFVGGLTAFILLTAFFVPEDKLVLLVFAFVLGSIAVPLIRQGLRQEKIIKERLKAIAESTLRIQ